MVAPSWDDPSLWYETNMEKIFILETIRNLDSLEKYVKLVLLKFSSVKI